MAHDSATLREGRVRGWMRHRDGPVQIRRPSRPSAAEQARRVSSVKSAAFAFFEQLLLHAHSRTGMQCDGLILLASIGRFQ